MVLSAALAIVLFTVSLWLFYPGLVSTDSILQFREAQRGSFTTEHPPMMAATWRLLLGLGNGALPMLVMDLLLYWASFFALAIYCIHASYRPSAPYAVLAGLCPLLLSFSGVIWKDVVLASAWGLACGLMQLAAQYERRSVRFWSAWATATVLVLFGTAMRHNAAPAALVLIVGLCSLLPAWPLARRGALLALALVAILAVPMSTRLFRASDSKPVENLISWDLTGISYFSGRNYRDPSLQRRTYPLDCYSPRLFDACPIVQFHSSRDAMARWGNAIAAEPTAYLKHRALVFSMLLRFGCVRCQPYIWEWGNRSAEPDLGYTPNAARTGLSYVVRAIGLTPLGRPYAWLAAAILLSAMFWKGRSVPHWRLLGLITLSGAVYALGYSVAAVTDEFRYVYWLIYSVVLAGTALLLTSEERRGLLWWIVAPLALLAVLDFTVQKLCPTDRIAPSMATNY